MRNTMQKIGQLALFSLPFVLYGVNYVTHLRNQSKCLPQYGPDDQLRLMRQEPLHASKRAGHATS